MQFHFEWDKLWYRLGIVLFYERRLLIKPFVHYTRYCVFFVVAGTVKPFQVSPVELVDYLMLKLFINDKKHRLKARNSIKLKKWHARVLMDDLVKNLGIADCLLKQVKTYLTAKEYKCLVGRFIEINIAMLKTVGYKNVADFPDDDTLSHKQCLIIKEDIENQFIVPLKKIKAMLDSHISKLRKIDKIKEDLPEDVALLNSMVKNIETRILAMKKMGIKTKGLPGDLEIARDIIDEAKANFEERKVFKAKEKVSQAYEFMQAIATMMKNILIQAGMPKHSA